MGSREEKAEKLRQMFQSQGPTVKAPERRPSAFAQARPVRREVETASRNARMVYIAVIEDFRATVPGLKTALKRSGSELNMLYEKAAQG